MDSALAERVGRRVRDLRTERGSSLSTVARDAGIGKGSLSELEAGTRNPTLATLYAVAGALDVPLASLLANVVGSEVSSDGMNARLVDVDERSDETVETYVLTFEPDSLHRSPPHGVGVCEHIVVTSGCVRFGPQRGEMERESGQYGTFPADGPHSYAAIGGGPASAVLVMVSPHAVAPLGVGRRP